MKTRKTISIPPARDRQLKRTANGIAARLGMSFNSAVIDIVLDELRRAEIARMRKERK